MDLTISSQQKPQKLQSYEEYELLIDSLKKSMSVYSNIDFDEINVLFN